MKLLKLLFAAVITVCLTSCLGEATNTITQDFTAYSSSYITDMVTGETTFNKSASYRLITNIDKGTATIEINGLKLPNGTYISLKVEDQRYTYNEKSAMVIKTPAYQSEAGGSHEISNLNMELYSRFLQSQSFPLMLLTYTVDERYSVRLVYNPAFYWGTTTVVDQDGQYFVNSDVSSYYGIQFNTETGKAVIGIVGAKFAEKMPSLNMSFRDIPYTFTSSGYVLETPELIPLIGETPYPDYKITNVKLMGSLDGRQTLEFTCTIDTERMSGSYHVMAALEIIPAQNNN